MRNPWPDPKLTPGYSWVGALLLMMLCRAILGLLAWAKQFPSHLIPKLSQTADTDGAAASPPTPWVDAAAFLCTVLGMVPTTGTQPQLTVEWVRLWVGSRGCMVLC